MDGHQPQIQGVTVVLLGDFNPKIFQPAWFSAEGLIRDKEAEKAEIEIIHSDVVSFTLDWLRFQVTPERLLAATTQEPYYEPLRDLILGTFSLLRHTPIDKMGINREMHFRLSSEESWHTFGHRLAPKTIWNGILHEPGMRSLTMEGKRQDDYKGCIRAQVEPSVRVHPGVYIKVNDHYEVEDQHPGTGCEAILEMFENSWNESLQRASQIGQALMEKQ